MLLIDGVDGDLGRSIPVNRRCEQHRGRIVGPVEFEPSAVWRREVIESDLGVCDEVLPSSRPTVI